MKDFEVLDNILKTKKNIHFVGIGGVSMSGIAEYLILKGYNVTGSDKTSNDYTKRLKNLGAKIFVGHSKDYIKGADLIIYTAAIFKKNPELIEATSLGIPTFERAVVLGYLLQNYKNSIGVAGTHGKTTTTALITCTLLKALKDPTVFIGGKLPNINGNVRKGNGDVNVYEACEFVDSFLNFFPNIAVILNIEEDHLDYFKNLDNIILSFKKFLNNTPDDGYAVVFGDDENVMKASKDFKGKLITFGFDENNEYFAKNIKANDMGFYSYDLYHKGEFKSKISLCVPGKHYIINSMATAICARILCIDYNTIYEGIRDYKGAGRRFEYVGDGKTGFHIYDDYAHHPTEIETVYNVTKNMKNTKFHLIVQPHTFTRTKLLFDEFVDCLSKIDNLILTKICAAREEDIYGISSLDLMEKLPNAVYCDTFSDICEYCEKNFGEDDSVITIGCGDIYLAARMMRDRAK